jgi:hypothetical protein
MHLEASAEYRRRTALIRTETPTSHRYAVTGEPPNTTAFPVMRIQSFAHASAIKRCRKNRILLTVLGYQVLPARINGRDARTLLKELTPIIGPMPFRVVQKRIDRIEWENDKNPFAIS